MCGSAGEVDGKVDGSGLVMTDEELNARIAQMTDAVARLAETTDSRFEQMANAVSRLAESTDSRIQELTENDRKLTQKLDQLAEGYLGLQKTMGVTADLLQGLIRENRQWRVEQAQINEESHRRHEEHEQRFNVLLEEIRFMNRQQHPPE